MKLKQNPPLRLKIMNTPKLTKPPQDKEMKIIIHRSIDKNKNFLNEPQNKPITEEDSNYLINFSRENLKNNSNFKENKLNNSNFKSKKEIPQKTADDFKLNGEYFKKFLDHYEKRANENLKTAKKVSYNVSDYKLENKENNIAHKEDTRNPSTDQENERLRHHKNILVGLSKQPLRLIANARPRSHMKLNNFELTNLKKEIKNKIEEKFTNRPISYIKLNSNNLNFNNNVTTNGNINTNTNNNYYNNILENLIPNLPTENNIGINSAVINHLITSPVESVFKGRIEDYKFIKEIGKGAYAVVKSAVHRPTGAKYAIKIYEKYKLMDPAKKTAVKREIQILKQIDHKNIVKMYEVIDAPKQIYLVLELVEGESLLTFVKSKPDRKLDENSCKSIFQQIIQGIFYLHSKNIFHRDIKLENIIIKEKTIIKIIDFGFGTCSPRNKLLNFFCGTPSYMPPEIVLKKDYLGEFADIWSIGILLYTILCGAFPFRALSEKELYNKITKGIFNIPEFLSGDAKSLLQKILNINPKDRLDSENILQHQWLNPFQNQILVDA